MGCSQSAERVAPKPGHKIEAEASDTVPEAASAKPGSVRKLTSERNSTHGYAAFLSHYKVEAATEARWLQGELEPLLGGLAFLDSV